MTFVNPYTFISFPTTVKRGKPLGHAPTREQAQERYTGKLTVTWTLKTPLAIPNDGSWGLQTEADNEIRIPGASVKGAVRSLHEALFAGCARIMNPLYTPVYRDMMTTSLLTGWQLAVVVSPDANVEDRNQPTPLVKVVPCGDVSWTLGSQVKLAAAKQLPRTGDFIAPGGSVTDQGRQLNKKATHFLHIARNADWGQQFLRACRQGLSVILVTDTAARDRNLPYYWATAKPAEGLITVSGMALSRFRQRLRGADRSTSTDGFEDVHWPPGQGNNLPPGPAAARRRTVEGWLRQGDVIWVRTEGGEVVDIKLSLGWRVPAGGSRPALGARVPQAVSPCQHSDSLCLSCGIFGSVDAEAKEDRDGSQDSYGGHVRFGDAEGTCATSARDVELAPLGTPHPGAGMYYLTSITSQQMAATMKRPDLPSHWDSKAGESRGSRDLRGRKFYWHANPQEQQQYHHLDRPRYERQDIHTNEKNVPTVHLVTDAKLTQTITFDGLDPVALASLLATLNPSLLLGPGDYALHLGRGKPLGLGSVQATVSLEMTTTADRYAEYPIIFTSLPDLNTVLATGVPGRCGVDLQIQNQARKVLSITGLGVQAVNVSYPTTQPWSAFSEASFHESYEFFQKNSGQVRKNKKTQQLERGPWKPLPSATERQEQ